MVIRFEKSPRRAESRDPRILPFRRLTARELEHRRQMLQHLQAQQRRASTA
jgi:hypothetical protein